MLDVTIRRGAYLNRVMDPSASSSRERFDVLFAAHYRDIHRFALRARDREALRLVAWEGLSIADAARAAGVPRATFAMRLHRARRRLAQQLDPSAPSVPSVPDLENAR